MTHSWHGLSCWFFPNWRRFFQAEHLLVLLFICLFLRVFIDSSKSSTGGNHHFWLLLENMEFRANPTRQQDDDGEWIPMEKALYHFIAPGTFWTRPLKQLWIRDLRFQFAIAPHTSTFPTALQSNMRPPPPPSSSSRRKKNKTRLQLLVSCWLSTAIHRTFTDLPVWWDTVSESVCFSQATACVCVLLSDPHILLHTHTHICTFIMVKDIINCAHCLTSDHKDRSLQYLPFTLLICI